MQTPRPTRIHHLLAPWADSRPAARALQDRTATLSYGDTSHAVAEVARQLRSAGVRAGDRVLIVGENCVAAVVAVLAISAMDAWSVFVNARLSEREVDLVAEHSGARRALYTCEVSADAKAHAQRHGAVRTQWPLIGTLSLGPIRPAVQPEPVSENSGEQVAAMIYTSGTSGMPKAVMLTHANLIFVAQTLRKLRRVREDDHIYGVLPMAHIVGLSAQMLVALHSGASLFLEPRFSADKAAEALARDGITAITGVPAMFARLLEWSRETGQPIKAPTLRYASVAGSPLTPALKSATEAALGMILHNSYGLTETAPVLAQTTPAAPRSDCSVGFAVEGVEVRIVDKSGNDQPSNEVGEIWVRGPNLMKGYYHDPVQTREAFSSDGWFKTGDLATRDADGAIFIVGRLKEMIIRSGFNVYPAEVELVLNSHPDVVQSAVVGRTVGHNEEVVAFVEARAGADLSTKALVLWLRERLSPYKLPSEIRFLDRLPAAPTGKILKGALKELAGRPPAVT